MEPAMIDEVVSTRIEPEGKHHVYIKLNDDTGQFFYLTDGMRTALMRERIARMCLSAWFEGHRGLDKDPYEQQTPQAANQA
jgi:hypothetical protein